MKWIIIFSSLFLTSCVYDTAQVFTVKNNTDSVFYVCSSSNDSLPFRPAIFAFDTFKFNGKDTIVYDNHRLDKQSLGVADEFTNESEFKSGVYVFYIHEEIMKTKDWDSIAKYQLYTKRVYYSYDSLIKNDFKVEYP